MTEVRIPKPYLKVFSVSAGLGASATTQIQIPADDVLRFAPFNFVSVTNLSGQSIQVVFDGVASEAVTLPKTFDKSIGDRSFSQLSITNLDTGNATDDAIYVSVFRDLSAREFIKALANIRGVAVAEGKVF